MAQPGTPSTPRTRNRLRLTHEVGLIATLLMEVVWLVPWFRALTPALGRVATLQGCAIFLAVALLAALLARAVRALELRPAVRSIALLALLAASAAIALRTILFGGQEAGALALLFASVRSFAGVLELVPAELVVILAVLYAWRRGVMASVRDPLEPAESAHAFRLGIVSLAIHALVYRQEQAQLLFEAIPLYFGAALAAIGLARADRLSVQRGGGRTPFRAAWLAAILGLTTVTVGLGVLAGLWLQSPWMTAVAGAAAGAIRAAGDLLLAALTPLAIVLGVIIDWVFGLLRQIIGSDVQTPDLSRLRPPELPPPAEPGPPPEWLILYGPALRVAGTLALLLILALAALRSVRRRTHQAPLSTLDLSEAVGDGQAAGRGLRGSLDQVLGAGGRRLRRRLLAAQAVRRLYQRLLLLAEKRGLRREPAVTPYEFVGALLRLFPDHAREVRSLTEAYVRVRYGEIPEGEDEIRVLRACLAALQSDGGAR